MSIKLTQLETWRYERKKEIEITPQNFEEFKKKFISCYLEKLEKHYEVDANGKNAWLEKAKNITLKELEEYINLEHIKKCSSWDIMKKYNIKTGCWSLYVIDEFCDFLEDLKDGWIYGEFNEGSHDTDIPSYEIKGEK